MTDRAQAGRRRVSPGTAVILIAIGGFLIVLTVLSLQMRAGRDPALGGSTAAETLAPRTIVKRRIVRTRVIITDAPAPAAAAPSAGSGDSGAASSGPPPVVTSAPIQVVRAAPAPAPVPVTRTS